MAASGVQFDACCTRPSALLNPPPPPTRSKSRTTIFSAHPTTLPSTQLRLLHSTFLGAGVPRLTAAAKGRSRLFQRRPAMAAYLPENFGYVALTIVASGLLTQWQAVQVGMQRRKYKVRYPKMYEDAENSVFNCYQRAHQNTLESYPAFLALLIVAGLGYPITSSILGSVWIVGRVVFSLGYYTGNPDNRIKGSFHYLGVIGLAVTSVVFALQHINIPKLL